MTFNAINLLGAKREPFLFISDFKAKNLKVILLKNLQKADVEFQIKKSLKNEKYVKNLKKTPLSFGKYKDKFNKIIEKIKAGETYLLNLTSQTQIETSLSLEEIYANANADYKLRYKDEFICFSPERFIKIQGNKINTYPMKGTIDSSFPDAKNTILQDKKEMAEHIMVEIGRAHV